MAGARGLLINITGGDDLTLFEVDEAVSTVRKQVDEEANVLFGSATDPSLEGRIRVSVVATGIDGPQSQEMPRPKLVAVGGGASFAEPQPIHVPTSAPMMQRQAEPVMQIAEPRPMSNITALRQQAAQPQAERVIIPDPMPLPEETAAEQPALPQTRRPVVPVSTPKPSSSLFAHSPVASVSVQPAGDSVARSLFQTATGLFRKRATPAVVVDAEPEAAPARRREPMTAEAAQEAWPSARSGELTMEADRPREARTMAVDDSGLDIPAFLRRQSS